MSLSWQSPLAAYDSRAEELLRALRAGDGSAAECFKWEHPRFRGRPLSGVSADGLELADARLVVAHQHGFESWADLAEFAEAAAGDGPVARFERAVEAVVSGHASTLRDMLRDDPGLLRARSARRHRATLLHYVAANGTEVQRTPPNAVEIATILLDAGAEPDAVADMYEHECTTMSMLVSSSPPAEAGLQAALACTLLDHGARLDGVGTAWQSALMTALSFGFLDTARTLVGRGARVDDLAAAAGLGRLDDATRLLPDSDARARHAALALAAQHGHAEIVRLLLNAGEDPDRLNPEGHHAHATPLHHAALAGHEDVVRLLVERGARLDIRDTIYEATPLGWAEHGGQAAVAAYLRGRGAT